MGRTRATTLAVESVEDIKGERKEHDPRGPPVMKSSTSMPSLKASLQAASIPGSPLAARTHTGNDVASSAIEDMKKSMMLSQTKPGTAPAASTPMNRSASAPGKKKSLPQFHQTQFYTKPFDVAYEELAKARNLRKLEVLFIEADADGSGEMSLDEFREALRLPRIQRAFSVLGVQPHQSEPIFRFLDKAKTGEIGIADFMSGLTSLVGTDVDGTGKELDIETLRPAYKAKMLHHVHYMKAFNTGRPSTVPTRVGKKGREATFDLGATHLLPKIAVQRAFVTSASAAALACATASRKGA